MKTLKAYWPIFLRMQGAIWLASFNVLFSLVYGELRIYQKAKPSWSEHCGRSARLTSRSLGVCMVCSSRRTHLPGDAD